MSKNQSQNQNENRDEREKQTSNPYECWVWSPNLKGIVHHVSERYDGNHSLNKAIARFMDLYGDRHFRIDQNSVVVYINEPKSKPVQLSLFDT